MVEVEELPTGALAPNLRLAFCLAGHAIFTLRNTSTENRLTFKIVRKKDDATRGPNPLFWVSVLAGPDNEGDYTYLGFITKRLTTEQEFVPNRKHCDAQSSRAFVWAWPRIVAGTLPGSIEFHHAGRCCRCGRTLTTPESIASGIGPKCAEKGNS